MVDYRSETANFTWDRTLVLGKGSVGCVYYGRSKSNSKEVAVKSLIGGDRTSLFLKLREIEVVRKLNHENIVKVLAVEEEMTGEGKPSGVKALIMELCTGGNLATALRKPENHYGFPESEFLRVWEHLTAAMHYLRGLNISHRDLKPANILIYIKENGLRVYKVADFDTAKELDDGETFPSIVGTVPYLNPQMYQRAITRIPGKNCSTTVDLWSIGVTLYETATGKLPFRPHNWNDRNEMHQILCRKPSGAISGVQEGANGHVTYATTFPTTCNLSQNLKDLLAPVIASLCESHEDKQWSYKTYFENSDELLKRKRVHVFYVNAVSSFRLYLSGKIGNNTTNAAEPNYFDLIKAIQAYLNVPTSVQILFYKGTPIKLFLEGDLSLRPIRTTEESPLLLWNTNMDSTSPIKPALVTKFKQFGNIPDIYADAKRARSNMKHAYAQKRILDQIVLRIQSIHSAVSTINQYVVGQLVRISKEMDITSQALMLENNFEMMSTLSNLSHSFLTSLKSFHDEPIEEFFEIFEGGVKHVEAEIKNRNEKFKVLKHTLKCLSLPINQITDSRVQNRSLLLLWDELVQSVPDINSVNELQATASKLIFKMEHSYNILQPETNVHRNVEPESISHTREYYRHMERLKFPATHQTFSKLVAVFHKLFESVLEKFGEWYSTAYFVSMQPEILATNLEETRTGLSEIERDLNQKLIPAFRSCLEKFSTELTTYLSIKELSSAAKDYKSVWTQTLEGSQFSQFLSNFTKLKQACAEIDAGLQNNVEMLDKSVEFVTHLMSRIERI